MKMMGEFGPEFQQSVFSRREVLTTIMTVAKYLFDEEKEIGTVADVIGNQLSALGIPTKEGVVAGRIDLRRIKWKDERVKKVVLVPFSAPGYGKKDRQETNVIQIARKTDVLSVNLIGCELMVSDKFVVKFVTEEYKKNESNLILGDSNLEREFSQNDVQRFNEIDNKVIKHRQNNVTTIALINCPSPMHPGLSLPLSLETLKSYLDKKFKGAVCTKILDIQTQPMESVVIETIQLKPKIIGISAKIGSLELIDKLLSRLRDDINGKNIMVVLGDLIPTFSPKEVLQRYKYLDNVVACHGNGELTMEALIKVVKEGRSLESVPNVAYFDQMQQLRFTERMDFDLSKLPIFEAQTLKGILSKHGAVWIEGSRGCEKQCTFCNRREFYNGRGWRGKPLENIFEEIRRSANKGMRSIIFTDDDIMKNVSMDDPFGMQRVKKLAIFFQTLSLEVGETIQWSFETRVDAFFNRKDTPNERKQREELWNVVSKSGLINLCVGIESGCNTQLKRYRKGYTVDEVKNALNIIEKCNIHFTLAGFIPIDPLMKLDELEENVNFLESTKLIKRVSNPISVMRAQRGSPYVETLKKNGLIGKLQPNLAFYNYKYKDERVGKIAAICTEFLSETYELYYLLKTKSIHILNPETLPFAMQFKQLDFELLKSLVVEAKKQSGGNLDQHFENVVKIFKEKKAHILKLILSRARRNMFGESSDYVEQKVIKWFDENLQYLNIIDRDVLTKYEMVVAAYGSYYKMADKPSGADNIEKSRKHIVCAAKQVNSQGTAVISDAGRLLDIPLKELLKLKIRDDNGREVFKFKNIVLLDLNTNAIKLGLDAAKLTIEEAQRIKVVKIDLSLILSKLAKHLEQQKEKKISLKKTEVIVREFISVEENWSKFPFCDMNVNLFVSSGGVASFYASFAEYLNQSIIDNENSDIVARENLDRVKRKFIFLAKKIAKEFLNEALRITSDTICLSTCVDDETSEKKIIGVSNIEHLLPQGYNFAESKYDSWKTYPAFEEEKTLFLQMLTLKKNKMNVTNGNVVYDYGIDRVDDKNEYIAKRVEKEKIDERIVRFKNRTRINFATKACNLFNRFNVICGFSLNASKDPRDSKNFLFKKGLKAFRDIFALSREKALYSFEDQCRNEDEVDKIRREDLFHSDKRTFHIRKMKWQDEEGKKKYYSMDLVNSETARMFGNLDSPLYRSIRRMNPECVSIHLGSSAENVSYGSDNQDTRPFNVAMSDVLTREEALRKIVQNINLLQKNLKKAGYDKPILLETLDYHNIGAYEYVTNPDFVKEIIEKTGARLLIDCAHLFVSAKNMPEWKERPYMDYVKEIVNEETIDLVDEIHLTVPALNTTHDKAKAGEYLDYHRPFYVNTSEGDAVRNILGYIMELRESRGITEPVVVNFETDVEEAVLHVTALMEMLTYLDMKKLPGEPKIPKRELFGSKKGEWDWKRGDGITLLMGAPFKEDVRQGLEEVLKELRKTEKDPSKLYLHKPEHLHITVAELMPNTESVSQDDGVALKRKEKVQEAGNIVARHMPSLGIKFYYKDLTINKEGDIIALGYASDNNLSLLREELEKEGVSSKRTNIVHMTIGRVMDENIIPEQFDKYKELIKSLRKKVNDSGEPALLCSINADELRFWDQTGETDECRYGGTFGPVALSCPVSLRTLTKEFAEEHVDKLIELQNTIPDVKWVPDQLLCEKWNNGDYGRKNGEKIFFGKWKHSVVAVDGSGEPVGLLLAYERPADEEIKKIGKRSLYIHGFARDVKYKGMGIGAMMMREVAGNLLKKGYYHMKKDNDPVITLKFDKNSSYLRKVYEELGFKCVGESLTEYEEGEDHNDFNYVGHAIDIAVFPLYKSEFARNHAERVKRIALLLAGSLGVSEQMMGETRIACAIHDLDTPAKTEHISPEAEERVRKRFNEIGIDLPKWSRNVDEYTDFLKRFAESGGEFTAEEKDCVLDIYEPCAALSAAKANEIPISRAVETAVLFHHHISELENYLDKEVKDWSEDEKRDTITIASLLVAADSIKKGMNLFKQIFLNKSSTLETPDETREYLRNKSGIPKDMRGKILNAFDKVKDSKEFKEIAEDAGKISDKEQQDLKKVGRGKILSEAFYSPPEDKKRKIDENVINIEKKTSSEISDEVTKLFEIVAGVANNRRDMLVEKANSIILSLKEHDDALIDFTSLSRDTVTSLLIEQLRIVSGEGRKYMKKEKIADAVNFIESNLDLLETDNIVSNIIIRARKAARRGKTVTVAFDFSWIPGFAVDKTVRDMVNPVLSRLTLLEGALRSMDLDNVYVFTRKWDEAKTKHEPVEAWAQRVTDNLVVPADFSDVMVFGGMEAVNYFDSKLEKENVVFRKRAFLVGVDSSGMDKNELSIGRYWDLEILKMVSDAFEAFAGKNISGAQHIDKTRSNLEKKLLIFFPGAEIKDIGLIIDKFKAKRKALISV